MPIKNATAPILVPYPDWDRSADSLRWLDADTYNEQIRIAVDLLKGLQCARNLVWLDEKTYNNGKADLNHANNLIQMWSGYEWHLALYGMKLLGRQPNPQHEIYDDPTPELFRRFQKAYIQASKTDPPYWFGENTLHDSHQCWLIRHDHLYKRTFGTKIAKAAHLLPLCWPPSENGKVRKTSPYGY